MDKNTEAEQVAVDDGVQAELPKNARWHRREARNLLIGKSGMTDAEKIVRMQQAVSHLEKAMEMIADGMGEQA